jgi:hypothetical protein
MYTLSDLQDLVDKYDNYTDKFFLHNIHIILLRNLNIYWDRELYYGAVQIDAKRPYGNSDVWGHIVEILEIDPNEVFDEDHNYINGSEKLLNAIHCQVCCALQVVLSTASFDTGWYRLTNKYKSNSWIRDVQTQK